MNAKGLTLIELLVAVSIASMVTLGIEQLLDTALTAWRISIEEVTIARLSEDVLQEMIEGNDDFSGVRDALEVVDAEPGSIQFVPMWVDSFSRIPQDGRFYLTKRLRAGTPPPVCEIKFPGAKEFQSYPAALYGDESPSKRQWIEFGFPIKEGSTVLVGYQPDVKVHPELVMEYRWELESGRLRRYYNQSVSEFALRREGIKISSAEFTYYDGRNQEVDLKNSKRSKASTLAQISAVKIALVFEGKQFKKTASSLVNIRALGKSGHGVLLSEGLEIPVPDSEHIKVLQLVNFTGITNGNVIELKVGVSEAQNAWRLKLILGVEDGSPILRRFEVYYPGSQLVLEKSESWPVDQGLDLLSIDPDGFYDYDDDPGITDQVMFKGEQITLSVVKSDPEGVMLAVRP